MDRLWLKYGIFVLFLITLRSQLGRAVVKTLVEAEALDFVALDATVFVCVYTCETSPERRQGRPW